MLFESAHCTQVVRSIGQYLDQASAPIYPEEQEVAEEEYKAALDMEILLHQGEAQAVSFAPVYLILP